MPRIDDIFADLRARGETALMPFITAGYPGLADTRQAIPALERAGAKVVEVGFPFSDPIADGPVIASSMHDALCGGVTPDDVLEMIERVRADVGIGLIAMVSHSIVAAIGIERFLGRAAGAGVDGLIIPDIDLGAAQRRVCRETHFHPRFQQDNRFEIGRERSFAPRSLFMLKKRLYPIGKGPDRDTANNKG